MSPVRFQLVPKSPKIVGSFGNSVDLRHTSLEFVRHCCDIAEIRLDLLFAESGSINPGDWSHLAGFPLLFTARREDEGGAGRLDSRTRSGLLMEILDDAALIDIEVASIPEMKEILNDIRERGIPWIASSHDFVKLPETAFLETSEALAIDAGASVFKAAAMIESPADLARLAGFQLTDHAIPVSTMGMGPLAPVSRLLCAQAGSVLNYGYIGNTATAPGQWDSALLKQAVSRLSPISG